MENKTYRMYGAFLSKTTTQAMGLPAHVNQGDVIIVAPTKRKALEMALARKIMASMRDQNFRLAGGNAINALDAAEMLERPRVLAYGGVSGGHVVEIDTDGKARRVGRIAGGVFVREMEKVS